ncbi:GrpB family protein [Cryobacterium sp. TMT2-15-1]|uniref:GrpB family protein n=1 Tax=Cryobacterium sp. TMT2-15-1 TaxID=1259246 RepID=UPI003519F9D2
MKSRPRTADIRVREYGHRMLRTAELDFHVHVLPPETTEQIDYLDLRDWLRVSAADRALYESTTPTPRVQSSSRY